MRSPAIVAFALGIALVPSAWPADESIAVTPQQTSEEAAAPAPDRTGLPIELHGELSAMVATDGSRAVAGTVIIPLGEKGELGLAFETGRYGAGTAPLAGGVPLGGPPPFGPRTDCGSIRPKGLPQLPACDTQD